MRFVFPSCGPRTPWHPGGIGLSKSDVSFNASQLIGQTQNIANENGNNIAFASGITATIKSTQTANNNINF